MGASRRASRALLALACAASAGCGNGLEVPGQDADTDDGGVADPDADADAEADADADAEPDGDLAPGDETTMPFLVEAFAVVVDRVCDVDGDGFLDNAVADIGEPAASLAAMMLNSVQDEDARPEAALFQISRVDDAAIPSADETEVLFLSGAVAAEVGEDGADAFWLTDVQLDGCGEPLFALSGTLEDGQLTATGPTVRIPLAGQAIDVVSAWVVGRVAPHGTEAQVHFCGVATVRAAGGLALKGSVAPHTLLELVVAGGAVVGVPGVPGGSPDVDLDGDGLERFVVDEDGFIERCVDGDLTVIEGRDCWQDERIADGFSLTAALGLRPARFLGPHPASNFLVDGTCEALPVEDSLFGGCDGELCERWGERACAGACDGESSERCDWDCVGYGPCMPEASEVVALEACDDLEVEGGATCLGPPPSVSLVGGPIELRGAWLVDPVTVGMGPVAIEARVLGARGASDEPGGGWGIAAYLGTEGDWLGPPEHFLGFNCGQRGYGVEWAYETSPDDPTDRVQLRVAPGTGEFTPDSILAEEQGASVQPVVGADDVTPVAQRLRLLVGPDVPETEENELSIEAQYRGDEGTWVRGLSCHGSACPVEIRPGDVLRVGVFAAGYLNDARIELAGDAPLSARATNVCP